jgi:hypothetical protein
MSEPCEICGFDMYTEKHHPHGRKTALVIEIDGVKKYITSVENDELYRDGKHISVVDVYTYPYAVVYLCHNCHIQLTKGYTLTETINYMKQFVYKKYKCIDDYIGNGKHIFRKGNEYIFEFSLDELTEPETNTIKGVSNLYINERMRESEVDDMIQKSGW